MKNKLKLFAAGLTAAALLFTGCSGSTGRNDPTADPKTTSGMTESAGPIMTGEPAVSTEPTGTPGAAGDVSASPDIGTADPSLSAMPGANAGTIDGFMEGAVVDPADIREVVDAVSREFPEHTIQSVTEEYFMGMQAYRMTLQGDGDAARLIYVLAGGAIVIPGTGD